MISNYNFLLVQGRSLPQTDDLLQSFPKDWEKEFLIISELGFSGIEWIYDEKSSLTNPILSKHGKEKMMNLSKKNHVSLENIVFDWFISHPLLKEDEFSVEEKMEKLFFLLDQSRQSGFKHIILPLLEKNSLNTINDEKKFLEILNDNILKYIEKWNIELDLETSLPPDREKLLINKINSKNVKICFDMGNSASYGYAPENVIATLKDLIGVVHVKDREFSGPSEMLNFPWCSIF
jgi:hexulose-6-phosphate isomerase